MMVHGVDEDAVVETGSVEAIQQSPLVVKEILVVLESLFFTFTGWYPVWVGSVLALVLALFVGKTLSGGF